MPTQTPKRPSKVKVLTVTYDIHWLTEDEWYAARLDGDAVGITERDMASIAMRADSTANEDALKATLMHELMHCCTQAARVDKELANVSDGEEFFIAIISPLLLHVLQANPKVAAYLLDVK